ncbi:XrtA-associated tyrosine autokinase [Candidatus Thiodiazotropha sp. CDECU1]|uniref:XrtA-associated tyrosine autokinase n=1 Tax=Candidatus Thiodiazotropha sp. CDECU1 TaxID=3065865 RepID=UPI00292EB2CC|nr:XrtA-associated tyrosine autokinase [Candidatus Thiodiazotropha sp. CDECU1]
MSSIEKAIERLAKTKSDKSKANDAINPTGTEAREKAVDSSKPAVHQTKPVMQDAGGQSAKPTIPTSKESVKRGTAKKIQLDYESLSRIGYIVPHAGNKQLSEEYRIIKRPIIMNALGKGAAPIEHGNLVSISSSLPSEGKTFTALNLALSISTELDSTVLLIDGDVLRYSLSKLLGIEDEKGLIDVLEDKNCTVGDVILETQIPKLKIIAAGKRSEKSTELLASKEMEELLNEVAVRYQDRIIIFDSPPLLSTSESIVLNQHMGQVLVVVEAGGTPVDAIKDTLSRLDSDKAIGLVLNKSRESRGDNYYGTYY